MPTRSIALPGDAVFPEGVTASPDGTFYVGSTSDGTVFRGRLGQPAAEPFLPAGQDGRTSAVGMKLDVRGRLLICGGATAKAFLVDLATKATLRIFDTTDGRDAFVNDVALAPNGDAYLTDSRRNVLFRVGASELRAGDPLAVAPFVVADGAPIPTTGPTGLNGLAVSSDGRVLVTVHAATGGLFRVDLSTRAVTAIATPDALTGGDGLVLTDQVLRVVRAGTVDVLQLDAGLRAATRLATIRDPSFRIPTTAAAVQGRLLVVNAQFDKRGGRPSSRSRSPTCPRPGVSCRPRPSRAGRAGRSRASSRRAHPAPRRARAASRAPRRCPWRRA